MADTITALDLMRTAIGQGTWDPITTMINQNFIMPESIDMVYNQKVSPMLASVAMNNRDPETGSMDRLLHTIPPGGTAITWTATVKNQEADDVNANGQFTPKPALEDWSKQLSLPYAAMIVQIKDSDFINQAAMLEYKTKYLKQHSIGVTEGLARRFAGNSLQYYDGNDGTMKNMPTTSLSTPMRWYGLGWGASTTDNIIMGATNNYAGLSRTDNPLFAANMFDCTGTNTFGKNLAKVTSIKDLTLMHILYAHLSTYTGNEYCTDMWCSLEEYMRFQKEAEDRKIINRTDSHLDKEFGDKYGFDHFRVTRGLRIVLDQKFARPGYLQASNTKYTKPVMVRGWQPHLSPRQWQAFGGIGIHYQQWQCVGQVISENPHLNLSIFGYEV